MFATCNDYSSFCNTKENYEQDNIFIIYNDFIKNQNIGKTCIFRMSHFHHTILPSELHQVLDTTHQLNPDYIQVYLDYDDCEHFLNDYYPDYVPLWKSLQPGAYKSDLVRICLLHEFGGMYCDIGCAIIKSISNFLHPTADILLVNERTSHAGILNGFMYAKIKRHPFLKEMIDSVCYNISNKLYGENELDITGPYALGKVIERIAGYPFTGIKYKPGLITINNHILQLLEYREKGDYIYCNNEPVVKVKFDNYYKIMYSNYNKLYYKHMWHNKTVFT